MNKYDHKSDHDEKLVSRCNGKHQRVKQTKLRPHVLLVDDDPLVRCINSSQLNDLNCVVDTANDGEHALNTLSINYDVIFLDIDLPDMSGLDVARLIRSRKNYTQTPIIALTTHKDISDTNYLRAGINAHIEKPAGSSQLAALLSYWLIKGGTKNGKILSR